MWDTTVAHFSLAMRVDSLENLPFFAVPERYGWRFYQPGDELFWARIETSAGEFKRPEEGLAGFERAFAAGALPFLADSARGAAKACRRCSI